jgi:hypothetical protein
MCLFTCVCVRQSTIIAALATLNVIPTNGTWVFYNSVEEVATGLQVNHNRSVGG